MELPGRTGYCTKWESYLITVPKDFAQAMVALRGLFGHEGQIGGYKGPFVITDVCGVRFSFHTPSLSSVDQSA
jgi:hypothetical protein